MRCARDPGVYVMIGRLENVIVGATIALVAVALAGLVALLAKLIFKKSIGTSKYYSIVSGILWVLMSAALLSLLPKTDKTESVSRTSSDPISLDVKGLDAQFIALQKTRWKALSDIWIMAWATLH